MNYHEFATKYLGSYKEKEYEIIGEKCPYCNNGFGKDKFKFFINTAKAVFTCHRGSCGMKGTFYKLLLDFGEIENKKIKKYIKPKTKSVKPKLDIIKYFDNRNISNKTLQHFRVGQGSEGIHFNYYEAGEKVMVKYRQTTGKKSQWRETGGKPIFYNMDNCKPNQALIIVEGEIDALSVYEAGYPNVVSLPSGSLDMTCMDLCWEWIEQFQDIYIWVDKDTAGEKCEAELVRRLGEWRCWIIESPYKDANEHLCTEGKESVLLKIDNPKQIQVTNVHEVSDIEPMDLNNIQAVKSNIRVIDHFLGGFLMGLLSVWTGVNGSGKSTVLNQLMIESIDQGYNSFIYSAELPPKLLQYWLELQMAGDIYCKEKPDAKKSFKYYVPLEIREKLKRWYSGKLFFYNGTGQATIGDLLKSFEYAVRRHNCKVFLIDNLMKVNLECGYNEYYHKETEFVCAMTDFAKKFNVHIHLVVHPKKVEKIKDKSDIGGSGHITNQADNVLMVERADDGNLVGILKNRIFGEENKFTRLRFSPRSKRVHEDEPNKIKYGWEHDPDLNIL